MNLLARLSGHGSLAVVGGAVLIGVLGLVAIAALASRNRSKTADTPRPAKADRFMTFLGAAVATGVVATGMWRFFGDKLHIQNPAVRVALFAFFEIAMLASALRSRRFRIARAKKAPSDQGERRDVDVDGIAVWVLALLSGSFAATDQTSAAAAGLRLVAPLIAAWLWERGLAGELSHFTRAKTRRITNRLSVERVLVALRLAEPTGRGIGEVDKARRLARLARTAFHLHMLGKRARIRRAWWTWRLRRQIEQANEHLSLATDPGVRAALRANLATLYQALTGTTPDAVKDLAPWSADSVRQVNGGQQRRPARPDQSNGHRSAAEVTAPDRLADTPPAADTLARTVVGLADVTAQRKAKAGQSDVSVEQLADTLGEKFGAKPVGKPTAQDYLKEVYGSCSNDRAIEAKNIHNKRASAREPADDKEHHTARRELVEAR
jgi:hypothetical protein